RGRRAGRPRTGLERGRHGHRTLGGSFPLLRRRGRTPEPGRGRACAASGAGCGGPVPAVERIGMLSGLSFPEVALLLVAGILLDLLLGEPRRWHPLVGFGTLAQAIEASLNRGGMRFVRGLLGWGLAVLPLSALAWLAARHGGLWLHAVLLYACIGLRSLHDHTMPIVQALHDGDLATARMRTSWIVSRDTRRAQEADL